MMLSSLTVEEIRNAILSEDVNRIKSVKGIGLKSAQRMILELKDKVVKGEQAEMSALFAQAGSKASEEATTALIMLGFTKSNVTKAVNAIVKDDPTATVETIIRKSLQRLS
jgi:Holliday junction DNA helicase RuvA